MQLVRLDVRNNSITSCQVSNVYRIESFAGKMVFAVQAAPGRFVWMNTQSQQIPDLINVFSS